MSKTGPRVAALALACVVAVGAGAQTGPPAVVPERPPAPAFAFPALGDSATVYTPESFAGRFVLVDVWASWCVPCHAEIPRIAAAHAEHAGTLDVLSVSLDLFPDDVAAFRARVAPMDWHHAWVGERFDHPSLVALGADRLPTALLIGPDGTIRARGSALRHDLLAVTVAREIAAHAADAP